MSINEIINSRINRIAESHFFLKPVLISALKKQIITAEGKPFVLGAETYFDFWVSTYNDKFYDMGVFIRLGAEVEICLRDYYIKKKGYDNLTQLISDPKYKQGAFQRILPWQNNPTDAISLFKCELGYDLNANSKFRNIQELMILRHLYAHNAGLINEKFIIDYKKVSGTDITILPIIKDCYPAEDCYFFAPLNTLNNFIEDTRTFFKEFPSI